MTETVRNPSSLPGSSRAELRKPLQTVTSKTWVSLHKPFPWKPILPGLTVWGCTGQLLILMARVAAIQGAPAGNFQTDFLNKCQVSPTPSLCPHSSWPPSLPGLSVQPFIYPKLSFPQTLASLKELWPEITSEGGFTYTQAHCLWPTYNWFGFKVRVIQTEGLHLRLETHFQQEPQFGKEERNMLLTPILVMLSSNISWPVSAPTLQPSCLCKGQTEHH